MKKLTNLNTKQWIGVITATLISVFVAAFAFGAVTLNTNIQVGSGTIPDLTLDGDDVYIKGTLEVDGAVRFDGAVTYADSITLSGPISVDDTTDTTSGITGSIHTDGGLGIAKALYVGTTSTFAGNLILPANTDLTFTGTTGTNDITLTNTLADALSITYGASDFMVFNTETPSLLINPATTITGVLTASGGVVGALTGNASTATALQTARTINGTSFDGTANITITADAGTLTGTTLNATVVSSSLTSVGTLTGLTMGGDIALGGFDITNGGVVFLTEQAAAEIDIAGKGQIWVKTATPNQLWFTDDAGTDVQLGVAVTPTVITVADTVDTTSYVALWESATGDLAPKSDAAITYNAGTGALTATTFVGNLTGDVTGNVSGTSATVTGAAQAAITSLGTLTTLSVDNITIDGNDISSTAGIDLTITPLAGQQIVLDGTIVVDAGVVTGATSITSTDFVGALTGNASTATALQTARTINGTSFDGTANITITADAGTLTGTTLNATVVSSSLTSVGTLASPVLTTPDINGGTADALTSLGIRSTGTGAFDLVLANTENLTATSKTLTLTLNDANRILTITGDATISGTNTGDNTVATSGDSPTDFFGGGSSVYVTGGTDVSVADGGTGKSSWTQWLIPYADTTTSFSQIAIGTSGQVLTSNGAGAAPTFQDADGGGLVFVAADTTERTTSSITAVDLVTISNLNITAGTRVRVVGKFRKTSGFAHRAGLGLKLNTTVVAEAPTNQAVGIATTDATDAAEDCIFELEFEVGESNYQTTVNGKFRCHNSSTGANISEGPESFTSQLTNLIPAATVTDIIIRGIVGNAAITLGVDDVRVYTYANS